MSASAVELTAEELSAIRAPIEEAVTLPARAFTSDEFLRLEIERIFGRHWMGLAFESTLPDSGDMRPIELFGMPLVLVRGDDARLRVFHNICPYDGCLAVIEPRKAAEEIEVLYHGWRYDLRGRLRAIPYWDGTPAGDLDALGERNCDLVEIRSESRLGVLFIDLGGAAEDVDDYLAPLRELLSEYDLDRLVAVDDGNEFAAEGRVVEANWKTYLENAAINVLHEAFTHEAYRRSPEVPRVRDGERTYFTVTDGPLIAFGFDLADVRRTYDFGGSTPHLGVAPDAPPSQGFFITYYPNLAIPTRYNMMRIGICVPQTPGRTRILQCGHFHREAPAHAEFQAYHANLVQRYHAVYMEDVEAIEGVQKARSSPAWRSHFYSPFWDDLHYHLNNLVAADVARS